MFLLKILNLNEMSFRKTEILNLLQILTDTAFQQEVWIDQIRNHIAFCFDETVNLLDDYHFFELIKNDDLIANDYEYSTLDSLMKKLMNQPDNYVPTDLKRDTEWIEIMNLANKTIEILKSKRIE